MHYKARTDREVELPPPPPKSQSLFRMPLLGRRASNSSVSVPNYGSITDHTDELQPVDVHDLGLGLAPERHSAPAPSGDIERRSSASVEEQIFDMFDEEERKFFRAFDAEVERIERFYLEREHDAILRLNTLVAQLSELAEHRRAYRAHTHHENMLNNLHEGNLSRPERIEEDAGDIRRARAISVMHALDIKPAHTEHESHAPHDPMRYAAARKKLRAAVTENYRALEILNNYRFLNRQGFSKILKKFDKTVGTMFLNAYYQMRVLGTPLTNSDRVPKMIQGTEEIFASYFMHGDTKRARDFLREQHGSQSGTVQRHHGVVFFTGLYVGISACAVAAGFAAALRPETQAIIPQWKQLIQVYCAEFVPTLFAVLFGLNMVGWQYARINAVFIFEWDSTTALDPVQYFELPTLLLLSLCLCFWASFQFPHGYFSPTSLPLLWLVLVVVILANPLPVLHRSGRMWFVRSLARLFDAGATKKVEFRDFFLGDELNSLAWTMSNIWYIGCEGVRGWPSPDTCNPVATLWTPLLTAFPAAVRLGQCIRRYVDSDYAVQVHIVNAFKYLFSLLVPFCLTWYKQSVGPDGGSSALFALWCLTATVNSLYTASWDIVMDWNLLTPNAHYPLLRDKLAFDEIWPMYYVAMVTNVILRFAWVVNAVPTPVSPLVRAVSLAFLEMGRRWQWNFIRLENEHLGNADSFKIIRDMPLPYPVRRGTAPQEDDNMGVSPKEDSKGAERTRQTLRRAHNALVSAMRINQRSEAEHHIPRHNDEMPAPQ